MFTGDVVTKEKHLEYMAQFDKCLPDTKVYKSEVVEFVTEYRAFVSQGKIYEFSDFMSENNQKIGIDDDWLCFKRMSYKRNDNAINLINITVI